MKKIIGFLSLFLLTVAIAKPADSTFIVKGKLGDIKSGTIFLNVYGDQEQKFTSKIVDGIFSFKGFVQKPVQAYLTIKDNERDYLSFYLESGTIKIIGKGSPVKDLVIENSPLNDENKLLKQKMEAVTEWEDVNSKIQDEAAKTKNTSVLDSLDEVDFHVLDEKRKVVASFVKEHPHSLMSAMAIAENYAYYAEADEVEPLYNLLGDDIKNSPNGTDLKKLIALYKTVAVGVLAPDIIQNTPEGNSMSLSSLKGKYVLVDFWASWCGPCRRENPAVVQMYDIYKSKGFDVFGVSYDTKKDKWEKAIKDDGLAWNQVSDLQGWKNTTSDQYGIKAIPSNLLLDKDGRIIAKNIFGKKLSGKLVEILK